MVTLLITSLFILGFLAVVLYFWQKPATPGETEVLLPPPQRRGLFAGDHSDEQTKVGHNALPETQREEIVARAIAGEKSALLDAKSSKDPSLYPEVLSALAAVSEGPQFVSLLSYVSRQQLPVSSELAERFTELWTSAPNRNSTAEMLHIAALSDDARVYGSAVEGALQSFHDGHLADISAQELRSLIDGEFWILSSQARSSGAGFLLKQTLANARRNLASTPERNQTSLPD